MSEARERVLIVSPAWVGDMVISQALVEVLDPERREIHLLAPPVTAPLGERMPGVAATHVLAAAHGELALPERWRAARRLRELAFQRAIVLPNSFKSALVPLWARVPERTGWRGEERSRLLTDARRDPARHTRLVERFVALALPSNAPLPTDIPAPRLSARPERGRAVLQRAGAAGLDGVALALCPGAEYGPAKRWPARHFARVAEHHLASGRPVWLLGSPRDREIAASVVAEIPARLRRGLTDLCGRTDLIDAVDVLSLAWAAVTNDSGLMHVACAVGRPVVAAFGSTSPAFTPPLSDNARIARTGIDCSPCFARACPLGHTRCLEDLHPSTVIDLLHRPEPAERRVRGAP